VADERIFARCAWRLIPLMLALYFVNYLDRVNVAFASLTMVRDLNFSASEYGFGAGILFVGYFAFHVPANLILERIGARRWMFLILLAWGTLSAVTALVQGPISFFIVRFILGAAEAGLYPGLIFYLTLWFPPAYRARYVANFMIGLPLAFVIGSPVSGLLLELDGLGGLHGWQWMFILEGLPACVLAFVVLRMLPDGPAQAAWLSQDEKQFIATRLAAQEPTEHPQLWQALSDKRVILLGLIYLADQSAASGSRFWMPQIVQGMGFSNFVTSLIVALPFLLAMGVMFAWGKSSDVKGERVWHVAIPLLLTGAGFVVAMATSSNLVALLALSVSMIAPLMFLGPFWGLNSSFLGGRAAAGAIALVSAVGSLGGFVGPNVVGVLKDATGKLRTGHAGARACARRFRRRRVHARPRHQDSGFGTCAAGRLSRACSLPA
jgi:MFS transporter, ACS family, tartrate transporter